MPRSQIEIVTELKRRLDAYLADPTSATEDELHRLIRELDRARDPEQFTAERDAGPASDADPTRAPQSGDGAETSTRS